MSLISHKLVKSAVAVLGAALLALAAVGTTEAKTVRALMHSGLRITDPILIHHGTADGSCPIKWSEEAAAALKAAGKQVTYYVYPGQRHTFTSQWPLSIRRTHDFLERNGV